MRREEIVKAVKAANPDIHPRRVERIVRLTLHLKAMTTKKGT